MDHLDAVITLETVIIVKESVTIANIARKREEVRPQRAAVCNVLAHLSIGTEISLLKLKGNGTFRNLVFEGFCNGIALFSALRRDDDKDNNKDDKNGNNRNDDRFEGILRVCPEDVIAIAL